MDRSIEAQGSTYVSSPNTNFTERAKAWVKESEPDADQLQGAYCNMVAKLKREPELKGKDSDECLDYLLEAIAEAGGDIGALIASASQEVAPLPATESMLDASPLYEIAETAVPAMTDDEKRLVFAQLKASLAKPSINAA